MRLLGRIALLLLALIAVVVVVALALLPRIIASSEVRQAVAARVEELTGRTVSWRELSLGLLPPSIVVEGVSLAGENEAAPPLLRSEAISLRLSLWPLLAGVVLVDSLVVDSAVVELDLDADGLSLPSLAASGPDPAEASTQSPVRVAVRSVVLRDSSLVLVDRTREPPVRWVLERLHLEIEATSPEAPIAFEGGGVLAGGDGSFSAAGNATLAGEVEARVSFEALQLGRLAAYVPALEEIAGSLSGRVDIRTGGDAPLVLKADLGVADALVASGGLRVAGVLALEAQTEGEGPVSFTGALQLASGGRLQAQGSTTRAGVLDVSLTMSAVDLALVRPLVARDLEIAGAASGQVALRGPAVRPERVKAELGIADARVRQAELDVSGPLSLEIDLSALQPATKGRFAVDASAARIAWSDVFVKAPGVAARVAGPVQRSSKGELTVELESLVLASLQGRAQLRAGALTTISITAPVFDIAPVAQLLPSLADLDLRGRLALQDFGVAIEPFSLSGALVMDGLGLALPPEHGVVVLRGRAVGRGDGIRLEGTTVEAGEGRLALGGGVADLLGQQRFEFEFQSQGVLRANPLVSTFTSVRDTIYGPLVVKGRLSGHSGVVSRDELLQSLAGGLEFEVGEGASGGAEGGRIKGLSLLQLVFDQLGPLGGAALLAGPAARGKSLDPYYDDRFRMMQGAFEVRDGTLATRKLQLVYNDYAAQLHGRMRLVDQGLDMKGRIELGPALVSFLGGPAGGGAVEIPIASIRGSLADPKVTVTADTVTALVRQLLFNPRALQEATRQLDRVLPGVSDILQGGRSR